MAQILCSQILRYVDASTEIQFDLSKKTDMIQHTAIAVSFNGKPVFTLDYYPKHDSLRSKLIGCKKASVGIGVALATDSDIFLNEYHSSTSSIERRILKFMIDTAIGQNRAISLLKELSAIEMGEYYSFCNNCRHFVSKAIDVLINDQEKYDPNMSMENKRNSHQEAVKKIRRNDARNTAAASLVAVGFGAVLAVAYALLK